MFGKSFRSQLLSSYLAVNVVFITVFILFSLIGKNAERQAQFESLCRETELECNQLLLNQQAFMLTDSRNENYHRYGTSSYVASSLYHNKALVSNLNKLKEHPLGISQIRLLDSLFVLARQHQDLFVQVEQNIRRKGFKDYGIEGDMRRHIHEIENNPGLNVNKESVLQLRRHEKDFIIRQSNYYVERHELLSASLLQSLGRDSLVNKIEIELLRKYRKYFRKLVGITNELGSISGQGLAHDLDLKGKQFLSGVDRLIENYTDSSQARSVVLETMYYGTMFLALAFGVTLSLYFARRRAKPIQDLVQRISKVPVHGEDALENGIKNASSEMKELYESFKRCLASLRSKWT
ncbi:MAG: hypothetical protein HYZ16_05970 [Bacteroidetes bacterium]|nr:hypothetical protein [Bacteroidota bacterium]